MYNNPFYMPGYARTFINPSIARGIPNIATNTARASNGLLSRIIPGLSGIKKLNWGNLINNTSKTLGLINQTIPIVKQAGPMINNMKSIVKVASLFKDETDYSRPKQNTINKSNFHQTNSTNNINNFKINNQKQQYNQKENYTYQNKEDDISPTFFVST